VFRSKRHRRATRVASAVLAGLGALATGVYGNISGATSLSSVKIGVPAYFWPGGNWDKVVAGSADISFAVANIATGPGAAKNTAFVTQFAAAKAAGIKLYGYVDTTYGARSAAAVKTDIANYKAWYGITNIFFDETPWACDTTAYYADVQSVVHANGGTGILNPGGSSLDCWGPVGDIIVNFEGSGATYESWTPDSWTDQYPASKFWHIVYGTLGPQVANVVAKTKERNAAGVFVTDDIMPNPFDRMPDPTVWTPLLKSIGPVAVAVTAATTPAAGDSGSPAPTAAPVSVTTPPPVITSEAIATTTTAEPTTTTAAPTTTVAPITVPPATAAPTPAPTAAPTTAAPGSAPKATVPAATVKSVATPSATPTPSPAAASNTASLSASSSGSGSGSTVSGAAPGAATTFGAVPVGGIQIVNASDPAKTDPPKNDTPKLNEPSVDVSKGSGSPVEAAKPVPPSRPVAAASGTPANPAIPAPSTPASGGPTTTLPNSLALKPTPVRKPAKPAKKQKIQTKVAARPLAKAPKAIAKAIAKAGPKLPIAKAPTASIANQHIATPISASRIAAEH
jgi:Spherulation-specific family 4